MLPAGLTSKVDPWHWKADTANLSQILLDQSAGKESVYLTITLLQLACRVLAKYERPSAVGDHLKVGFDTRSGNLIGGRDPKTCLAEAFLARHFEAAC